MSNLQSIIGYKCVGNVSYHYWRVSFSSSRWQLIIERHFSYRRLTNNGSPGCFLSQPPSRRNSDSHLPLFRSPLIDENQECRLMILRAARRGRRANVLLLFSSPASGPIEKYVLTKRNRNSLLYQPLSEVPSCLARSNRRIVRTLINRQRNDSKWIVFVKEQNKKRKDTS